MTYAKNKIDIHEQVTNQIIDLLDQVDLDNYQPPFASLAAKGLPLNPTTKNHYQGVNILNLWFNQQAKKFSSNHWASFKQWKDNGAKIKKGEKGTRIVFYKTLTKTEENSSGETETHKIPMLRLYTVFNANQVENYNQDAIKVPEQDRVERISLVEEFCSKTGADIRHGGDEAFFAPDEDFIQMPETKLFLDTEEVSATENYYSTLLHELTHWTGSKHRLKRDLAHNQKEREKYAFEELVAELGAAFLCAHHGIAQNHPPNHALYIKSWLKALKDDKTFIFKASAQAAKAVDFLDQLVRGEP
tara:strand:- start:31540 stop:32445 length:906 start_codon:yes stop_codon:yes gene_type:complete